MVYEVECKGSYKNSALDNINKALCDLQPLLRLLVHLVTNVSDEDLVNTTGLSFQTFKRRRNSWIFALNFLKPYLTQRVLSNSGVKIV